MVGFVVGGLESRPSFALVLEVALGLGYSKTVVVLEPSQNPRLGLELAVEIGPSRLGRVLFVAKDGSKTVAEGLANLLVERMGLLLGNHKGWNEHQIHKRDGD